MMTCWSLCWFMIVLTLLMITASQHTESTVVTINNHGNYSTTCCVDGSCPCSSLSFALENLKSNSIVHITSESVTLNTITPMGSGNLHNITITGNGATVKCNNSGSVYCKSCSDVIIEGITWEQCGDPNKEETVAGLYFAGAHNITIEGCTYHGSQVCALGISQVSSNIIIRNTNFSSNIIKKQPITDGCSGLLIYAANHANSSITILDSSFVGNGYFGHNNYSSYGLFVFVLPESYPSLTINRTRFLSNSGGAYIYVLTSFVGPIVLSELVFFNNTQQGVWFPTFDVSHSDTFLTLSNSSFTKNGNGGIVGAIRSAKPGNRVAILVEHSNFTNNSASTERSSAAAFHLATNDNGAYTVSIQYCNFINNNNGTVKIFTTQSRMSSHMVIVNEVLVMGSQMTGSPTGGGVISIILNGLMNNTFIITNVNFLSNNYMGIAGGALFLKTANTINNVNITNSLFQHNTAYGEGAALFIIDVNTGPMYRTGIIIQSNFTSNSGGNSVVYISAGTTFTHIRVNDGSRFCSNIGTAVHLVSSTFVVGDHVLFSNNSANNGGALYLESGTQFYFDNEDRNVYIEFLDNSAALYGGAMYIDLGSNCGVLFYSKSSYFDFNSTFTNNDAGISGNSMYFNVHRHCIVNPDYNNTNSILYLPYHFNYDVSLSKALVSSPHSLILYFAEKDGVQIGIDTYLAKHNILGHRISFNGSTMDYFNHCTVPTQFDVRCHQNCSGIKLADDRVLVDNITALSLTLTGEQVTSKSRNVTLKLTSVLDTFNKRISTSVVIELVPCFPGYYYDRTCNCCKCYQHQDIVKCADDYNEMKRGYWFGTINNATTVCLCPNQYCEYGKHRQETRPGYCILPQELNDQCKLHRMGVACSECSSGYTLAYNSPDCISHHQCSPLMTSLVLVLTVLYWIAIVGAVFGVMNFRRQISSGYVYGILYYYSIVDILLDNNPYITDGVFQLVAILSSFAKLSPQLFGKLCFVEGLSRIDQQFIQYSHAIAISLFLIVIIIVARHRPKVAYYVSHCIIHVICLLLLLAYTSLASTSLQLLKPLTFAGVDDVYVYLSPSYKYFTGRHALYGAVAALSGLIIVIGMPLLLLLQPFINPRMSFIKIMPILDQFQSCYKGKYRYFASYYLICRLVVILIVFICDSNYYTMLYCLQTACVVIAMIHIWIQPYKDGFLNGLDGVILLTLTLVVNVNSFTFLSSAIPGIISALVVFPLLILCITGIKKLISCCKSRRRKLDYDFDELDSYDEERINRKRNKDMRVVGSSSITTTSSDDDYMLDP
ncbi:uncharacterized protein [Dysidea avara]|uniref:uncharacterized protein isoform X2 n=1 Tax=Dysidea avara TaxID=196820 RepID=UPI003329AD14